MYACSRSKRILDAEHNDGVTRYAAKGDARKTVDRSVLAVDVYPYADRIVIRQDRIVAEHQRSIGRDETVYDP
jgi:hypothetical protein